MCVPESKNDWSKTLASMLPAVPVNDWFRPGDADDCPWRSAEDLVEPVPEWVLWIPIKSLLYKVTADGSDEYLTSQLTQRGNRYDLNGRELTDMDINMKVVAACLADRVKKSKGN